MDREEMLARLKAGEDPLELSIEKWQDIVEGKGDDLTIENCALCELHNHAEDDDCLECPIYQATGQRYCYGTPYQSYCLSSDKEKLLKIAKDELEFLKALRKKEG